MDSAKQQVILVDPNTNETYKVIVKLEDVARIESDASYREKVLTDIIKIKNASSCLKPNASNNDVVEMQLMDASHQIYTLKVPAQIRDRALKDLSYATKLLNEHLAVSGNSTINSQKSSNVPSNEFQMNTVRTKGIHQNNAVYELTLIDPVTMESFTFFVDKETFDHAQSLEIKRLKRSDTEAYREKSL